MTPPAEPKWEYGPETESAPSMAPAQAPTALEIQLKELATAVNQMEQPLSAEVQRALANAQKMVVVDPAIQLQSAAAKFGNARDHLLQARRARQNLHNSWAEFISDAVQRWNKHSEDFEARDAEHVATIQEVMEKYQTAKEAMEKSKEAVTASDIGHNEAADSNEEELMADVTPSIQDDMKAMVQSFDKIRARQAEVIEGSAMKKARLEDGDESNGGKPAFGSRSLEPFGRGGK